MKYLLMNSQTGEENFCDKVTIDGFDYYVSDEKFKDLKSDSNYLGFVFNHLTNGQFFVCNKINELINEKYQTIWNNSDYRHYSQWYLSNFIKSGSWEIHKVIATNNPNIDIPKVVDEVYIMSKSLYPSSPQKAKHFIAGHTKSQETHPFSEEDMVEFAVWLNDTDEIVKQTKHIDFAKSDKEVAKELLQLWKFQQPKKVYYEK